MKILAVLAIAALTACGSPAPVADPVADQVVSYAPQAEVSPEPEPSPSPSPSPEVDDSANKLACKSTRRAVGDKADVFAGLGDGSSLLSDAADAAGDLQKKFRDTGSYAEGPVRVQMLNLSTAYGQMRVALTNGDLDALSTAVAAQKSSTDRLDTMCTAIGS